MDVGEVGFFDEKKVKYESIAKDNNFLKQINKTREEKVIDHEAVKDDYFKEISNKKKKFNEEKVNLIKTF